MEFVRNVIDQIATCCLNCRENDVGEPLERTPLLTNDHRTIYPIGSDHLESLDNTEYPSSVPKEKDDQSALNKIVQETNSNIIDVAALDTAHILEQSEYNDRVKLYNQRLAQQWNQIPVMEHNYNGLLKDLPNPENLLAFNPKQEDLITAKDFIKEAAQEINDMKVENQEELVVPFQVT